MFVEFTSLLPPLTPTLLQAMVCQLICTMGVCHHHPQVDLMVLHTSSTIKSCPFTNQACTPKASLACIPLLPLIWACYPLINKHRVSLIHDQSDHNTCPFNNHSFTHLLNPTLSHPFIHSIYISVIHPFMYFSFTYPSAC